MLFEGLGTTLLISVFAALLGLVLGTLVAMVGIAKSSPLMTIPKAICKIYVTIIRGTPMALQLFIMAYTIFAIRGFPKEITAIIAFGINSGAYVAEIIRGGIMSIDNGQFEAGRSKNNKVTDKKLNYYRGSSDYRKINVADGVHYPPDEIEEAALLFVFLAVFIKG